MFSQTVDYECSVLEMVVDLCVKIKCSLQILVMSNFIIKQNNNRQKLSLPQFTSEPRNNDLSYVNHSL